MRQLGSPNWQHVYARMRVMGINITDNPSTEDEELRQGIMETLTLQYRLAREELNTDIEAEKELLLQQSEHKKRKRK
jgi:hypothetical protein